MASIYHAIFLLLCQYFLNKADTTEKLQNKQQNIVNKVNASQLGVNLTLWAISYLEDLRLASDSLVHYTCFVTRRQSSCERSSSVEMGLFCSWIWPWMPYGLGSSFDFSSTAVI